MAARHRRADVQAWASSFSYQRRTSALRGTVETLLDAAHTAFAGFWCRRSRLLELCGPPARSRGRIPSFLGYPFGLEFGRCSITGSLG